MNYKCIVSFCKKKSVEFIEGSTLNLHIWSCLNCYDNLLFTKEIFEDLIFQQLDTDEISAVTSKGNKLLAYCCTKHFPAWSWGCHKGLRRGRKPPQQYLENRLRREICLFLSPSKEDSEVTSLRFISKMLI